MFDQIIRLLTTAGAVVLTGIALAFFGGMAMLVLTTYSVIPMPY